MYRKIIIDIDIASNIDVIINTIFKLLFFKITTSFIEYQFYIVFKTMFYYILHRYWQKNNFSLKY